MKIMLFNLFRVMSLALVVHDGVLAADGARLYNQADFMPRGSEQALLNKDETKTLAWFRARTELYINPQVIMSLNRGAFDSGVLTLVLPGGEEIQFIGSKTKKAETTDIFSWIGNSKSGSIIVSWGQDGLNGGISENGKSYLLAKPPGQRFHILTEVIPRPISEPPMQILPPESAPK